MSPDEHLSDRSVDHTVPFTQPKPTLVPQSLIPFLEGRRPPPKQTSLLRRRRTPALLVGLFVPLLVIPWILTCVLTRRPLNAPSYHNQVGNITLEQLERVTTTISAIRVLNAIAGVITVPLLSALLAQAAVVYSQRTGPTQKLSVRQVFALADRAWSDVPLLFKAAFRHSGRRTRSWFLLWAVLLILLGSIQQPVQQGLVSYNSTLLMTCLDEPVSLTACNRRQMGITAGFDPEPADLAEMPQNMAVRQLADSINTVSTLDSDPHMWSEAGQDVDFEIGPTQPVAHQTFFYYLPSIGVPGARFFVSSQLNGTTTGVLREHAIRMNSSISCNQIDVGSFPKTCLGKRPFTASYSGTFTTTEQITPSSYLNISICAPGEYGVSPWTLSRDRQDISEDLYVSTSETETVHCQANTTRGYYELGNYRNGYAYGPLSDTWPSPESMDNDWNDFRGPRNDYARPTAFDDSTTTDEDAWHKGYDPFGSSGTGKDANAGALQVSGPLMMSTIALFGNQSFFATAAAPLNKPQSGDSSGWRQICQTGDIPFQRLTYGGADRACGNFYSAAENNTSSTESDDYKTSSLLHSWMRDTFNDTTAAETALTLSMFFAAKTHITETVSATQGLNARSIYTAPGTVISKPVTTAVGEIVMSVLISLLLVGLVIILWAIYRAPSWTGSLNALAVARIGVSMGAEALLPMRAEDERVRGRLERADGLVGFVDEGCEKSGDGDGEREEGAESAREPLVSGVGGGRRLALGGRGVIRRM